MNTKNNRRRRASMEKIEKVFMELLQSKELNQITVSDICKRAGLNRSTFYANYADIYALADKIREWLEGEVRRLYEGENMSMENDSNFLKLFCHIKENQLFYKTYFKLGYDSGHQVDFYDFDKAGKYFDNKYSEYHIEFFKCGFNAIVKMWLSGGCKETPEEMTEILIREYRDRIAYSQTKPAVQFP